MPLRFQTLPRCVMGLTLLIAWLVLLQPGIANAQFGANNGPLPNRVRAPSLAGGGEWLNCGGPLDLPQLRGKFVILDFWTYCCINCMQVLPELKKLEDTYPNELVVIGVHSPKFANERDAENIRQAIQRYDVRHPVVNDANGALWNKFGVEAWPSLRVIDPEGYLIAVYAGEVPFEVLDKLLKSAIPTYKRKRVLDETPLRFDLEKYATQPGPLSYPGKVLADPAGKRLFIADSGHHRIVVAGLDGKLQQTIGSGRRGSDNGTFEEASFNPPQGMALDGDTLYVADTDNHMLRKIDLSENRVSIVAGDGQQLRQPLPRASSRPRQTSLASPWALWLHERDLYIAMAGTHRIWKLELGNGRIGPYAGSGREDIIDGPLLSPQPYRPDYAAFAQPSGLTSDGQWLYVADSEGSSIRAVPLNPQLDVRTVVGTAELAENRLFTFGDRDGRHPGVLLQHPLGVAYPPQGVIYIADTYNHKIKVLDPAARSVETLAGTGQPGKTDQPPAFYEPSGVSLAGNALYIADTNNHAIRVMDLAAGKAVRTLAIEGLEPPVPPEPDPGPLGSIDRRTVRTTNVRPTGDQLRLDVQLNLAPGYKLNANAPVDYRIEPLTAEGPINRDEIGSWKQLKPAPGGPLLIDVPLSKTTGSDRFRVTVSYYYCREGVEGLCLAGAVSWSATVNLSASARDDKLELKHSVGSSR